MPDEAASVQTAFIALGANLGDREATIEAARSRLNEHAAIRTVRCSALIETEPVGPAGQGPYLNGVTEIRTDLPARDLLRALLEIERSLGRIRSETDERWGARVIDLDILLYGDLVLDEPGLTIPHPRLHERLFVLEPFAAISPATRHPVLNRTVAELLVDLRGGERVSDLPPIPAHG
jgi:2-amino-4-hydroxy-6-hydroxymethyldihydropteridine diphosphokinase